MAAIALPFMIEMDGLIAGTLLIQGFSSNDICDAINQLSPLKDSQNNYGMGVVKNAERDIDESTIIAKDIVEETTIRDTYIGEEKVNSEIIGKEIKEKTRVLKPEKSE